MSRSAKSGKDISQYHPKDVEALLARLPDPAEAILVGGQAINFWATRYSKHNPKIKKFKPFTSQDIDFVAPQKLVKKWAKAIGAELVLPSLHDHVTINSAVLVLPGGSLPPLEIDILASIDGVTMKRVKESALYAASEDGAIEFRVLHPLHCLASVLANTYGSQRR
ncbi:MAG: hypothetical protein MJA83_08935, partial [Gammaproteobacteria bacterium]|nr:hypothetical protein [Gammaproteobacteria bacterium]